MTSHSECYYQYKFDSYLHTFMWEGPSDFHGAKYREELHFSIFKRVIKQKKRLFRKPIQVVEWEECFYCTNLEEFRNECKKYLKMHRLTDGDVYGLNLK